MRDKSVFNWSGGKDSALALYHSMQDEQFEVASLLTTVNAENGRITMHGVRQELLDLQAERIGIPLQKILLPPSHTLQEYDLFMTENLGKLKSGGYTHAIFGDIFLEDLRKYREDRLAKFNFIAKFPLWKRDTRQLINEFIELGFKTIVVCVKEDLLDKSFAGRVIDESFLNDLPEDVDPCGENGEFHTFVFDGPIFREAIKFKKGQIKYTTYPSPVGEGVTGFYFLDIIPQ